MSFKKNKFRYLCLTDLIKQWLKNAAWQIWSNNGSKMQKEFIFDILQKIFSSIIIALQFHKGDDLPYFMQISVAT